HHRGQLAPAHPRGYARRGEEAGGSVLRRAAARTAASRSPRLGLPATNDVATALRSGHAYPATNGTRHDPTSRPRRTPPRPRRARRPPSPFQLSDFVSHPGRGRRTVRIPRRLGVRPVSVAAADFHGSAGFFVRVGIIGLATLGLFGVLALRLWSLQVVRG